MALPTRPEGYVVLDDDWNAHVAAINGNTSDVDSLDSRVTALETADPGGPGRAVGVKLERRTSQSIPGGNDTLIQFDTETFTRNGISVDAGLTVVTIQQTGLYYLSASARIFSPGGHALVISKGTDDVFAGVYAQDGSTEDDQGCSTFEPLSIGDKVAAVAFAAEAGEVSTGAGRVAHLAVFRVGNL